MGECLKTSSPSSPDEGERVGDDVGLVEGIMEGVSLGDAAVVSGTLLPSVVDGRGVVPSTSLLAEGANVGSCVGDKVGEAVEGE